MTCKINEQSIFIWSQYLMFTNDGEEKCIELLSSDLINSSKNGAYLVISTLIAAKTFCEHIFFFLVIFTVSAEAPYICSFSEHHATEPVS